ncbi:hypothetical protein [Reyranella sp.]|jgi:hypothetical protein|uniref:hypothetical protein n=1 Tax=Reyranella sp. TaxID=1929291 RepID=UPI004036C22C
MVGLLRFWGCSWVALGTLLLGLYDWKILHHFPRGPELLEGIVVLPGLLFIALSFLIPLRAEKD